MNKTFSELWNISKGTMRGHWCMGILVCFIINLITIAGNAVPYLGFITSFLLFPLNIGAVLFFLRIARQQGPQFETVFEPFHQYARWLWGYARVAIFVFLWTLLLIIPGIIAAFRYSMTYWIMLDNPEMSVKEAMTTSSKLMYGHKARLFGYGLIFGLLFMASALFTLGIALFWLIPWNILFLAHFYQDLVDHQNTPEIEDAVAH